MSGLRKYFFEPRYHFSRLQFNLVSVFFVSVGIIIGLYFTAFHLIPSIFATTTSSITKDTDTDFNQGTFTSTTVSGSGAAAVVQLTGTSGFYNSAWIYRKQIVIDHTKVSADQTNFPVLISISSDSDLAANAQSTGNDILFTSSDGTTKLNHEIEKYDSTTGQLIAWVKVPTLSSTTDTILYMYYGNSGASNQQNKTGVWDANYVGVWHLPNGTSLSANDSTSNSNNGTVHSVTAGSGFVDGSASFGGSGAYVDFGNNGSTKITTGSLEAWIFTGNAGSSWRGIITKQLAYGMFLETNNFVIYDWGGGGEKSTNVNLADSQWHHVVVTFQSGVTNGTILYIDGGVKLTTSMSVSGQSVGLVAGSGGDPANGQDFIGSIDEVRVSNAVRTSSWIATEYNNQNSPSTFISLGTQTINLASSGTWESPTNSNVIDTVWNGGWGDGTNGSTAFSATVASVGANNSITFWMKTAATTGGLSSATYEPVATASAGTTVTVTKAQFDALGLGTGTNRYIQVKAAFAQTSGTNPQLDKFTIYYLSDNTAPETNASGILAYVANGGSSISTGGWTGSATPYFSWTAGADSQSGLKGYCLYLGADPNGDPATAKGLLGTSPVSTTGSTCQFIVSGTSIDLSVSGYIGTALTSGNDPYYFNIKAIDNGNNIDASAVSFNFKLDNIAPTNVAYTSCAGGNFSNVVDMNFSWPTSGTSVSSDSNSGLLGWQYQINSSTGTWQGTTHSSGLNLDYIPATASAYTLVSSRDSSAIASGTNIIYFRSVDTTGNNSSSSTIRTCNLSYGGAAPTFPGDGIVTVTPASAGNNSFALSWPAATPTSGKTVTHYYYMVNVSPPSTLATLQGTSTTYIDNSTSLTVAATALANVTKGTNTVYVVAIDNASTPNYSPSNYIKGTFTLNSTSPDPVQSLVASDSSIKDKSQWNVTLTWAAPSYQGAGNLTYKVYRSTDDSSFSSIGSTSGLSYVDNTPSSTLYYYYVITLDGASATSANSSTVSLTPTGKYTTAPALSSGPSAGSITTKKATITWSTSRSGDSRVAYGTTSGSYGSVEAANSDQVTSHSIDLSGLTPGTTYYYKAKWTDSDGNQGISDEKNFTTTNAPSISAVSAGSIGLTTAYVSFTISNGSAATVQYGQTTAYGGSTSVSTSNTGSGATYSVPLTGLTDGTQYHYRIVMEDADGNQYNSDDYTDLVTLPRPKITTVRLAQVENTAQTTILVTWTTNTAISSIITYWPQGNSGAAKDEVNIALTKGEHQMIIRGLDPKTDYILVVKGRDKLGNEATSDSQRFTTATDTRPPQLLDLTVQGETMSAAVGTTQHSVAQLIVSWNTDKPGTSQVEFSEGTGTTYSQKTQEDSNLTTNHLVVISGLTPSQVYHLRAISVDKYGNIGNSIDTVTIAPKATDNALNLVITSLGEAFGFLGGLGK